jgi:putative mRNA 3-end processing factor
VTVTVRKRDGISIDLGTGERVVADGRAPNADVQVLSHAHSDHVVNGRGMEPICSELTARLASARSETHFEPGSHHDARFELLNAGHIPGSRCLSIRDGETRILYTGDLSTRDRFYLEGFKPVAADQLILETTYGTPEYVFPPQAAIEREIVDWFDDTLGRPLVLFGYALGRAQELALLVNRSARDGLYVSQAIDTMNEVIETAYDSSFGAQSLAEADRLGGEDVVILPSRRRVRDVLDTIPVESTIATAGFSGWAVDSSFKFANGYDRTFPLTDHCDFEELLDVVEAVDPERVYTTHGAVDEFASHVTAELGIPARSLKRNQHTLADFDSP